MHGFVLLDQSQGFHAEARYRELDLGAVVAGPYGGRFEGFAAQVYRLDARKACPEADGARRVVARGVVEAQYEPPVLGIAAETV